MKRSREDDTDECTAKKVCISHSEWTKTAVSVQLKNLMKESIREYFEENAIPNIGGKNAGIGGKSSFRQKFGGKKSAQKSGKKSTFERRPWECNATDEWLEDGKSDGTIRKYKAHVDNFHAFLIDQCGKDAEWGDDLWYTRVTDSHLRKWRKHVVETSAPSIPHYRVTAVKSLFKSLCEKRRITHENPARYIRTPSKSTKQKDAYRLTEQDAERVIQTARKRGVVHSALVGLAYFGMVRRKEARCVNRDDCTFITEKDGSKRLSIFIRDGKGRDQKTRTIKLSKRGTELLAPLVLSRSPGEWIFPGRNGQPVSQNTVFNRIKAVLKDAGFPNASPHTLRHAGASVAHSRGASIASLRDMLGHSNVQVTNTYLHTGNEFASDYFDKSRSSDPHPTPRVVD